MPTPPNLTDELAAAMRAQVEALAPAAGVSQKLDADRTRERGSISDAHLAMVNRIVGDATVSLAHRHMLWSSTRAALTAIGQPYEVPEPKEGK